MPKKKPTTSGADDSWPWIIKLTAETDIDEALSLLDGAAEKDDPVLVRVRKDAANSDALASLTKGAVERGVSITIESSGHG